jgi:hypothetical protein
MCFRLQRPKQFNTAGLRRTTTMADAMTMSEYEDMVLKRGRPSRPLSPRMVWLLEEYKDQLDYEPTVPHGPSCSPMSPTLVDVLLKAREVHQAMTPLNLNC